MQNLTGKGLSLDFLQTFAEAAESTGFRLSEVKEDMGFDNMAYRKKNACCQNTREKISFEKKSAYSVGSMYRIAIPRMVMSSRKIIRNQKNFLSRLILTTSSTLPYCLRALPSKSIYFIPPHVINPSILKHVPSITISPRISKLCRVGNALSDKAGYVIEVQPDKLIRTTNTKTNFFMDNLLIRGYINKFKFARRKSC
jgi:hypothetical protein